LPVPAAEIWRLPGATPTTGITSTNGDELPILEVVAGNLGNRIRIGYLAC
jgi:hypothetical protein